MKAVRLWAVSLACVLLAPAPFVNGATPMTSLHLRGGLPWALSTKIPADLGYTALLVVASRECPCHWLDAYFAAAKTIKEETLPMTLRVLVLQPNPEEFQHLKDLGVREEHLMGDPDGSLAGQLGLSKKQLPYMLVISKARDGALVMAFQISKIQGDQRAQGGAVAFLRFLSGEQP